jgi:hypothetical protein
MILARRFVPESTHTLEKSSPSKIQSRRAIAAQWSNTCCSMHSDRYQWHNDDPDYNGLPVLQHFYIPFADLRVRPPLAVD